MFIWSFLLLIFSGGSSLLIRRGERMAGEIENGSELKKKKFLSSPHFLCLIGGGEGTTSLDSPLTSNLLRLI